jgi:hypothetical protein
LPHLLTALSNRLILRLISTAFLIDHLFPASALFYFPSKVNIFVLTPEACHKLIDDIDTMLMNVSGSLDGTVDALRVRLAGCLRTLMLALLEHQQAVSKSSEWCVKTTASSLNGCITMTKVVSEMKCRP